MDVGVGWAVVAAKIWMNLAISQRGMVVFSY